MKPVLLTLSLIAGVALAGGARAQDQADLVKKRDEKLAKPFVAHGGWITDYDQAREQAQKEGKPIFVYFTRSYAY
ncbi:MAG: hypothetical protein EYC70_06240 [Planctomycetota bacterium]|nr:MAG: hypothetical protein EYC70_06240 [Planctomycetota bacterium]